MLLLPVLAVATLFCFESKASDLDLSDTVSAVAKTGSRNDNTQGESQNIPYKSSIPYMFGYRIQDDDGNIQARQEEVDPEGRAVGSYSLMDSKGIFRRVEYIADSNGFRAIVNTNEPGTMSINPAHVLITREETPLAVQQDDTWKSAKKPISAIVSSPYVKPPDEDQYLHDDKGTSAKRLQLFYSSDRTFQQEKPPWTKENLTESGRNLLNRQRNPTYPKSGTASSKLLKDVMLEDVYRMRPLSKPLEDVLTEDLHKVSIQNKILKDVLTKDLYELSPFSQQVKKLPKVPKPETYSSEPVAPSSGLSGDNRGNANNQAAQEFGVQYESDISPDKPNDYHTSYSSTGRVRNRQPRRRRPQRNKGARKAKATSQQMNPYKFRRRTTPKPRIHIPAGVEDSEDLPLYKDK